MIKAPVINLKGGIATGSGDAELADRLAEQMADQHSPGLQTTGRRLLGRSARVHTLPVGKKAATIAAPQVMNSEQLDLAVGGSSTEWGVATGTAVALTVGAATVSAPVVAGALAVGGIVSAGMGIYYALTE